MKSDSQGNTALHIASKNQVLDRLEFLLKLQGERWTHILEKFLLYRNKRGLLPIEMSHNSTEEENEPDYLFVVKADRADFLIKQLEKVKLTVKTF